MHLTLTKREGNWAELIFAKTSGPVTGDSENKKATSEFPQASVSKRG